MLQAALWTWRFAEFSERGHARYGSTFTARIGGLPTAVLTTDRDAIGRLFSGDPLVKRHGNDLIRPFVGERSVMMLEPREHLARRRMLLPPFHGERVRSYGRLMQQLVCAEFDRLGVGDALAMQPLAQALTLDVILQAVLGVRDVAMRRRLREIIDALLTPLGNLAIVVPALAHRSRWNLLSAPRWRLWDEFLALLSEHISLTRADAHLQRREDILAMMVMARDEEGVGLSDEELRDELVTLIMAGHETTATAIAWGVELLAHNPTVMERARAGDDAYLEALAKETLRICSLLPVVGARHVLEPFTIGDWTIPPAVTILVDAYGVHHDPDLYPEPNRFRPERFLDEPPDGHAFLPFGGGAHRCLGAALAMLEIQVFLRELVTRLEIAPASQAPGRAVRRGVTIAPRGGAPVRVVAKRAEAPAERKTAPAPTAA